MPYSWGVLDKSCSFLVLVPRARTSNRVLVFRESVVWGIDIGGMELTFARTMRGEDKKQSLMLMSPETRVPQPHPL